jgi:membrane protein DedA with SNARE-associated domain
MRMALLPSILLWLLGCPVMGAYLLFAPAELRGWSRLLAILLWPLLALVGILWALAKPFHKPKTDESNNDQ